MPITAAMEADVIESVKIRNCDGPDYELTVCDYGSNWIRLVDDTRQLLLMMCLFVDAREFKIRLRWERGRVLCLVSFIFFFILSPFFIANPCKKRLHIIPDV